MVVSALDLETLSKQLGRTPRGVLEVVFRTADGAPAVIMTHPLLPDGTPFPTLYYLTDPRLVAAVSQLESNGVMRTMNALLDSDSTILHDYQQAHAQYLAERNNIVSLGTDFSGGGMPERVKCLHVLLAHSLAKGPGVNPIGDFTVSLIAQDPLIAQLIDPVIDPSNWPALPALLQEPMTN